MEVEYVVLIVLNDYSAVFYYSLIVEPYAEKTSNGRLSLVPFRKITTGVRFSFSIIVCRVTFEI